MTFSGCRSGVCPVRSSDRESFEDFVVSCGARVQEGLVALFGPEVGQDAASEALMHGWEHWSRVASMDNPSGYLFVVGRNRGRRMTKRAAFPPVVADGDGVPWVEPGLPAAIGLLSDRQRVVTLLVHGGDWTYAEVAELLDLDRGTVKKHADRGLEKLRTAMEVNLDA
jgi:DNA-directed RNA polymerase specialized sigma24 family protein